MTLRTASWPTDAFHPFAVLTDVIAAVIARREVRRESAGASCWDRYLESRPQVSKGIAHTSEVLDDARQTLGARAGLSDRSRFHQLVLPQADAAYNFARFLSRDTDGAQDIVQEAMIRAFRNFDGFRGGDVRAWLFTIVRNCHHDRSSALRRAARFEVALDLQPESEDDRPGSYAGNMPSDEDTPEEALIRKTDAERVRAVLVGLQESLREILVLREIEDLSYREIAIVINVPIGTVMSRLARARREFADAWSRQDSGSGARR